MRIKCPEKGFEKVAIVIPDEWKIQHYFKYHTGAEQAGRGASEVAKELYAAIALCDKIEGISLDKLAEKPVHYARLFTWLRNAVLLPYFRAVAVDPSLPSPSPTTSTEA